MMMDTSDLHSHKDGKASKVRFPADQDDTCNEIHAIRIPETNEIEVHAGFFKTNHRYEVVFSIEDYVGLEGLVKWNQDSEVGIKIQNVKVVDSEIKITLEYSSEGREGMVKEYFTLVSEENDTKQILVSLRAEILGDNQGTPMLKDGVRCIDKSVTCNSK